MKKKLALLVLAAVMVCGVPADYAKAATPMNNSNLSTEMVQKRKQTSYTLVQSIAQKGRPTNVQGMDSGSKYIYYVLHKDNSNNMIIKREIKTGKETILKSSKGGNYISKLNHGNDLAATSYKKSGKTINTLFVAAGYLGDNKSTKTDSLVRLDNKNSKVTKKYCYNIIDSKGNKISASGSVALVDKDSNGWNLLIRSGKALYYVNVPIKYTKAGKNLNATKITLSKKPEGTAQGMTYKDGNVYLVYSYDAKMTKNNIYKYSVDFANKKANYVKTYHLDKKTKFEMESMGWSGNNCYFVTNESPTADSLYKIKGSDLK